MTPTQRARLLFRLYCIVEGLLLTVALACVILAIGTMLTFPGGHR